jgi:hypothetical protein
MGCGDSDLLDNDVKLDLPAGLKLDLRREGEGLDYLSDARIGETVNFIYNGGSDPGGTRTVLVQHRDRDGVAGMTKERDGEYRRYDSGKAEEIDVVEPFVEYGDSDLVTDDVAKSDAVVASVDNVVVVRFDDAGDRLLQAIDGETLAKLYLEHVAREAESATFDANTGNVVVKLKPKANKVVKMEGDSRVYFENKRGERFTQYVHSEGKLGYEDSGTGEDEYDVTPEQLSAALVAFLSR